MMHNVEFKRPMKWKGKVVVCIINGSKMFNGELIAKCLLVLIENGHVYKYQGLWNGLKQKCLVGQYLYVLPNVNVFLIAF